MIEIIRTYGQNIPTTRFVGIQYGDEDRVDGGFGRKWGEWFENGRFNKVESLITEGYQKTYEDAGAYIGLMRCKEGEPFQYWIGMFVPAGAEVPEGYSCVDMPEAKLGVAWIQGPEDELYCNEDKCAERLAQDGYEITNDPTGACWFFERYGCPRFTTPDGQGRVILDICFYVK